MKIGTMISAAGVLALGLASTVTPSKAQSPMFDRVEVNLPYTVTINDKTLPPGNYVIQEVRDTGGDSRVLMIYSDNGTKFETSAVTIPTLDINTPSHTSVVLHHFGPDYYFDKVWIEGKDYGYEFPLPSSVKEREKERMEPVTVAATYSTAAAQTVTEAPTTTPAPEQTPPSAERAETPAPVTTPTPTPAPTPAPMPHTSVGWLMMLLGGGALSGTGMSLRRFRK